MPQDKGRVIITGGAGFIGSHFVDALMTEGYRVTVFDDLSSGRRENVRGWEGKPRFIMYELDLEDSRSLMETEVEADLFLHLAADPEVRTAERNPQPYVKKHARMTENALKYCKLRGISNFVLASSSTVYGDATVLPTPEDYEPSPISVYGRMKLECESLLTRVCEGGSLRGLILRFANIVGPRGHHGVIYDLVRKLQVDPSILEVLGDGTQRKSYLEVEDCVEASLVGLRSHLSSAEGVRILNVGNRDWVQVSRIAEIVVEAMGLKDVRFVYHPASRDGRGWKGDVKEMQLDISRLESLGWKPRCSSEVAVRLAAKAVVSELKADSN